MKTWIKFVIVGVIAMIIIILSVLCVANKQHIKSLKYQVSEQSAIIDSLLERRMGLIDVQLYVTDKSRNIVHGKYNRGSIYMPQERRYILQIDSTHVNIRN